MHCNPPNAVIETTRRLYEREAAHILPYIFFGGAPTTPNTFSGAHIRSYTFYSVYAACAARMHQSIGYINWIRAFVGPERGIRCPTRGFQVEIVELGQYFKYRIAHPST